jgi:hypothetical protein
MEDVKIKCVNKEDLAAADCTVGKVYDAKTLDYLSEQANGHRVTAKDAITFTDDIGDSVYTRVSLGFEIV